MELLDEEEYRQMRNRLPKDASKRASHALVKATKCESYLALPEEERERIQGRIKLVQDYARRRITKEAFNQGCDFFDKAAGILDGR